MVGEYHQFNGHELGQIPGDGEGQGDLVCCNPWSQRVRYNLATERLSLHPLSSQAGGPEASSSPCCSCGLSQVPRASSKVSGSPECESNTCCLHNTAQIAGPSLLLGLTQRKLRPVPTRAGSSGTGPRDQQGTFLGV